MKKLCIFLYLGHSGRTGVGGGNGGVGGGVPGQRDAGDMQNSQGIMGRWVGVGGGNTVAGEG